MNGRKSAISQELCMPQQVGSEFVIADCEIQDQRPVDPKLQKQEEALRIACIDKDKQQFLRSA